RLHHDVPSGDRDQRAVVGHAVLRLGLRGGNLVVAAVLELAVVQGEDRVRAPFPPVGGAAAGSGAATPFVGEDDLFAVVAEGRGVPVGEVRIHHLVDADGVGHVPDVQQDAVARAGPGGQP